MNDDFRIGHGYDIHRLEADRRLILCGVQVPFEKGLLGHSDADAPVHALIDALLGALALGDIGRLFPDTDAAYKDADSLKLLQRVMSLEVFQNWEIVNADITIIAQAPKLAPYIDQFRFNLANTLHLTTDRISVKAKTAEGLGDVGHGNAIEATAIILLRKTN